MRIVVAIDSFKGSLTSLQAGEAVREAALRLDPAAQVSVHPLADGGEGTVEALTAGLGGHRVRVAVTGPLGDPVEAVYGILPDGVTAVMEMAAAAGLPLVPPPLRNPLNTTTYGVGEMIRDAIHRGCRRFILGIGGSATNDGGIGMLEALGYALTDRDGRPVPRCGRGLETLHAISAANVLPELAACSFRIACDVTNPLCGETGCSAVFAPQKGATPETVAAMDGWLARYAALAGTVSPGADSRAPGAGAAGGLGFAFQAFTNAVLQPGIAIVLEETGLEHAIREADLVITGEGRLDAQTVMGKAPAGVAGLAKKHGRRVIAFAGCIGPGAAACNAHGIDAYFPILREITTLEGALEPQNAYRNLTDTAEQVFRLVGVEKDTGNSHSQHISVP